MRLIVDVNNHEAVSGFGTLNPPPAFEFKSQDTIDFQIYFVADGIAQDMGAGFALKFGMIKTGDATNTIIAYQTASTYLTDVNGNVYYQMQVLMNTSQMVTAIGTASQINCTIEIRYQDSIGEIIHTLNIPAIVFSTVLVETGVTPPGVSTGYPDASTIELLVHKNAVSGYAGLDSASHLNGSVVPVDGQTIQIASGQVALASILGYTAANFTTPASGTTVPVTFASTANLKVNSYVRIPVAGYYIVNSITDSTHAVLQNNGDPTNVSSGTTITSGAAILPAQAAAGGGGTPGQNAYTNLTNGFTVPAIGATVSITVASTAWMGGSGYGMFISGAGYYLVSSITDSNHAVVINSGSAANQPVGTSVPSGGNVTAAGPQGPAGSSGASLSAYDSLSSGFTMPSVGSTITMVIGNTAWLGANQIIYVASAGYFQVATIVNATNFTATNLNYPGNATAGTAIAAGSKVSPGGLQGPQGAGGPGLNAYTTLSANFTQPAVNATVTINVGTTAWMAVGQGIFVQGGGYYAVQSISDLTHAVVTNLGGSSNAGPGATVAGSGTQNVNPVGVPGTAGANAFTTLFTGFIQPSTGATVTANVGATAWMAQGQILYIPGAGYYSVSSITDSTHVVLSNLGYTGNAATGANIASGAPVVAAGLQGVPGPQGATGPTGSGVPQENLGAHLESPTAKTYTVDLAASSPYTIRAIKAILGAGSLTIALNQNGSAISGAGSIAVTTTLSSTTLSQAVALNDKIQIVLSALTGSPADLQFTMWIQR